MAPKAPTTANRRAYERLPARLTCDLSIDGHAERALVLDLSARGVFVQTHSRPPAGSEVQLRVQLEDGTRLDVQAVVARTRKVHPGAIPALETRGLGLELKMAPEAYFQLLRSLTHD